MFSELRLAWSAGQWMMSAWTMARVNEVHWCTGILVYWYSKMSIATCNREVKVEIPAMDIRKGRNVSEHQVCFTERRSLLCLVKGLANLNTGTCRSKIRVSVELHILPPASDTRNKQMHCDAFMRGRVADAETCVKKLPSLRYIYVWTHGYICHFTQTRYNVPPTSEWEVSAS